MRFLSLRPFIFLTRFSNTFASAIVIMVFRSEAYVWLWSQDFLAPTICLDFPSPCKLYRVVSSFNSSNICNTSFACSGLMYNSIRFKPESTFYSFVSDVEISKERYIQPW